MESNQTRKGIREAGAIREDETGETHAKEDEHIQYSEGQDDAAENKGIEEAEGRVNGEPTKGRTTMNRKKNVTKPIQDTLKKIRQLAHKTGNLELQECATRLEGELTDLLEEYGRVTVQLDQEQELQPRNGLFWKGDVPHCPVCWGKRKQAILMSRHESEPGLIAYRCPVCERLHYPDKDGNYHRRDAHCG